MWSPNGCRAMAWVVVMLVFLMTIVPEANLYPLYDMCGLGADWQCTKNIEAVPTPVGQVCDMCGEFWGNNPALAYCCRCDHKIFEFCLDAVYNK